MWYIMEGPDKQLIIESDKMPPLGSDEEGWTSRSSGYKTKEALWKGCKILEKPCVICSHWIKSRYQEECKKQLIEKNMCFSCNFWDERAKAYEKDNGDKIMVVNSYMYNIQPDLEKEYMGYRGFGGREFRFQMLADLSIIKVSYNVWANGEISKHFLTRIKDNAIIL